MAEYSANEGEYGFVFFRGKLASFFVVNDYGEADGLAKQWRAAYGAPASEGNGSEMYRDVDVLARFPHSPHTERLVRSVGRPCSDEADRCGSCGYRRRIGGRRHLRPGEQGDSPTKREPAGRRSQGTLTLIEETPASRSYEDLVAAIDASGSGDSSFVNKLEVSGRAFMLAGGTRVVETARRLETANVLHEALRVEILSGSHAGETAWLSVTANLKDCTVPEVRAAFSICNGP